jgi:hypothetical protein
LRDRRYFLWTMVANLSVVSRLSLGAEVGWATTMCRLGSWLRPSPAVNGLLGEHLVAGATGRLCIFGKNLLDVETLIFRDTKVGARLLAISDNEIMADITLPDHMSPGTVKFVIRTKSGETHAGGDITVIIARSCSVYATSGLSPAGSPGWPTPGTPGWPTPGTPGWPTPGTPGWPTPGTPGWPDYHSNNIERYYNDRPSIAGIGGSLL